MRRFVGLALAFCFISTAAGCGSSGGDNDVAPDAELGATVRGK